MTTLTLDTLSLPAAGLGPLNPLLPQHSLRHIQVKPEIDPAIPEEDRRYLGAAMETCMPYRLQSEFDRDRRTRELAVAVLENERLQATFLLGLGGRLWSLIHKPDGRNLLYTNPVFQPGNLAIRGAWFSGGVEWNCGMIGHTVTTCAPLFAARVRGAGGEPVLRLYEWHRIRQATFQLDFHLPPGAGALFVHIRLLNTTDTEIPMYWWSNIAFPETDRTRVLVPAAEVFHHDYGGRLLLSAFPYPDQPDSSYPAHAAHAGDFFFRIPRDHRPWIAAAAADGNGLLHTSTRRLFGRKLFVWGHSSGGERWQEFLSVPGHPYIEIQAGLTRTQGELIPMPPRACWEWLEAYLPLSMDPADVHAPQWSAAWNHVDAYLQQSLPEADLDKRFSQTTGIAARAPDAILQDGSGWAALEAERRRRCGQSWLPDNALVFPPESMGPDQAPWRALLETGELPCRAPDEAPGAFMVQEDWRRLLEQALAAGRGDHWLAWFHLGAMRRHAGDLDGAEAAWRQSLERTPSPWAGAALADLLADRESFAEAADCIVAAQARKPDLRPLAIKALRLLLSAKQPQRARQILAALPPALAADGRIRSLAAETAWWAGEYDECRQILAEPLTITDLREGDTRLGCLWLALHARPLAAAGNLELDEALFRRLRRDYPPPPHLDFAMGADDGPVPEFVLSYWRGLFS